MDDILLCVKEEHSATLNQPIVELSDGYTTDDITYQWDSDDPLQLSNNLDLPRFVKLVKVVDCELL